MIFLLREVRALRLRVLNPNMESFICISKFIKRVISHQLFSSFAESSNLLPQSSPDFCRSHSTDTGVKDIKHKISEDIDNRFISNNLPISLGNWNNDKNIGTWDYIIYYSGTSFTCVMHMDRIVKNELGGSARQQELRGWGVGGHNGLNRGTGGGVYQPPVNSNPGHAYQDSTIRIIRIL